MIKSAHTGAKLEFSGVEHEYFTVSYSSAFLSASHSVWIYTGDGERLARLFSEMARDWAGWESSR